MIRFIFISIALLVVLGVLGVLDISYQDSTLSLKLNFKRFTQSEANPESEYVVPRIATEDAAEAPKSVENPEKKETPPKSKTPASDKDARPYIWNFPDFSS